jgi:hypothetical protein
MSLFHWLKRKHPQNNHIFTDEEREYSKEIREKRREIELLKLERESELHKLRIEKQKLELQQEIEDLKNVYEDNEEVETESDNTSEFLKIIAPYFLKNLKPTQEQPINNISKTDIDNLWKNTPKSMKDHAKTQTDEVLIKYIQTQIPSINKEMMEYAISIIKQ